ncbi:MAG: hypothetical protein EOO27_13030 [Comamonadaceae bacterium]|nr:MAG: hypothetical protein EOO27_13030 [Comamonadaceae bacterium]
MRNRPNLSSARVIAAGSSLEAWQVDPRTAADLSPLLLDERGRLKAVPASELERTTAQARLRFGVTHGIYGFLTHELVVFLREFIAGRSAIEIGAGHGQLAAAIDIPATDNRQQEHPEVQAHYAALGQPTVRYGDHVQKLDALAAIEVHRPQVVIASWVTHLYRPESPDAGGSVSGVDEEALIRSCEAYVLIGNTHVHRNKSIWSLPHELMTPPWLYSRAINGTPDFIAIWRRPPA